MSQSDLSSGDRARSLSAVYACIFANGLGMGLSLPLLSLILERNGVSATLNGANAMFGAVAMIVVTPFIPSLAAHIGTARFLTMSYIVAALSLLLFRASNDIVLWFVLRFTLNSALQCLFVASEVWINQIATDKLRGRLIAFYSSIFSAGFALGPVLIQQLGTTGWEPFIAGAVTMLIAMIPLTLAGKLIPPIEHANARAMFGFVFSSPSAAAAALCYGAVESCAAVFLVIYAVRLGSPDTSATLLIASWGIGNMMLVPLLGWLADKTDRRLVLVMCGTLCAVSATLLPSIQDAFLWGLTLVFLWGGFVAAIYAIGLAHLGATFKGSQLGSANSAFAILYAIGAMIGPGLGGTAIDLWNPHGLVVILALIPAIFAGLVAYRAATFPRPSPLLTSGPE